MTPTRKAQLREEQRAARFIGRLAAEAAPEGDGAGPKEPGAALRLPAFSAAVTQHQETIVSTAKLPVDWNAGPPYRGVRVQGQWWITNGHVVALASYWEQPEPLARLLAMDDVLYWTHPPFRQSAQDAVGTFGKLMGVLELPGDTVAGTLLPVLLRTPSGSTSAVVRCGAEVALVDWRYAEPFEGAEWRKVPGPEGTVYALVRGAMVGLIMQQTPHGIAREMELLAQWPEEGA